MRASLRTSCSGISSIRQAARGGHLCVGLRSSSSLAFTSTQGAIRTSRTISQGLSKMRKPRRVLRSGLAGIGTVVGVAGGVSLWICGTRSGGRVHCDDLPVVVVDQRQAVDPFESSEKRMSLYEMFKLLLGTWYIVPLRVMLIVPALALAYVFSVLSTVGLSKEESEKKLPLWREIAFILPCRLITRLALFIGGFYWIKVTGKPATLKEAPIIVSNHVSYVDPVIYASTSQLPSFLAKQSIERLPLIGRYAKTVLKCLFVDRFNEGSRAQALEAIKSRVKDENNPAQILIFPEGTVTNGKALITFKQGAFAPGVPVQPVCIRYPSSYFDPVFPKGISVIGRFYRVMCQFVNHAEIIYLPVYYPSDEEKANPELYANNVRKKMAEVLGVPTTNHTIADALAKQERKDAPTKLDALTKAAVA